MDGSVVGEVVGFDGNGAHGLVAQVELADLAAAGHGAGNDVGIQVTVSESTTITLKDSQSGQTHSMPCSDTCHFTFTGVGGNNGTVTVTGGGSSMSASYGVKTS